MKKATQVSEMINAFNPEELSGEDLKKFYCPDTMYARTGNQYALPMRKIYTACKKPVGKRVFLLMGHRGCGKSTELNKMAEKLRNEDGYIVKTIQCGAALDLSNPLYTDLLILMSDALINIANDISCKIKKETEDFVLDYWQEEITHFQTDARRAAIEAEASISAEAPSFFTKFLKVSAMIRDNLSSSSEKRIEYSSKMSKRSSEWLAVINSIADDIAMKLDGKQPIIIFEDLDKLMEEAWDVFYKQAKTLTGFTFPVIYTFPIAISYRSAFDQLRQKYNVVKLPMIKVRNMDGTFCEEGFKTIKNIVDRRADEDLFAGGAKKGGVLYQMIMETGGSLRDLFYVINTSAEIAEVRDSKTVDKEDMEYALNERGSQLRTYYSEEDYDFLEDILKGNKQGVSDREKMLRMLLGSVVLEYNGTMWHDLHPLVEDFLKKQIKRSVIND